MTYSNPTAAAIHKLKIDPKWFAAVEVGIKRAEIRKNDRGFRVGDVLLLQEWNKGYTGRECLVRVTHILHDYEFRGLANGYVALSISLL
jgi:hypothetical protein